MRKRIKTAAICSSDNYAVSKRAHKQMLERNHVDNAAVFATISSTNVTHKSDLELWEEGLKRKIEEFKANYKL